METVDLRRQFPQLALIPAHEQIRGREYYQDPDAPAAPAPAAAGEHAC